VGCLRPALLFEPLADIRPPVSHQSLSQLGELRPHAFAPPAVQGGLRDLKGYSDFSRRQEVVIIEEGM